MFLVLIMLCVLRASAVFSWKVYMQENLIPEEIGRDGEWDVKIQWRDGHVSIYKARELRLKCPCAGCVEEMTGRPLIKPEEIPGDVHPVSIEPVGKYAIHITWSDGHDTGMYSFKYLRQLG